MSTRLIIYCYVSYWVGAIIKFIDKNHYRTPELWILFIGNQFIPVHLKIANISSPHIYIYYIFLSANQLV